MWGVGARSRTGGRAVPQRIALKQHTEHSVRKRLAASSGAAAIAGCTEQNAAIAGYVRWHNTRAQPKVNFAVGSPIRAWSDYPAKAS